MKKEVVDSEGLFAFEWSVDTHGYELANGELRPRGGPIRTYSPMALATGRSGATSKLIHREFLDLGRYPSYDKGGDDGDSEMVAFVNQFGLLGTGTQTKAEFWKQCGALGLFVAFGHDQGFGRPEDRDRVFDLDACVRMFNTRSPSDFSIRMARVRDTAMVRMQVVPRSMLSWMWLRFAQEKVGDVQYVACARSGCAEHFEVGASVGRKHKEYCSDNCRAKHWQSLHPKKKKPRTTDATK